MKTKLANSLQLLSNGIATMIKKKKKDKKLVSIKTNSHIKKLSDGAVIDKRLYVELSKSNPNNVIIAWDNIDKVTGFVFVLSDSKEEKLFAAGKAGSSEISWILNGKSYEFNFYEDAQKLKPIVRLSLVKSANELKQSACNLN